MSIRTRKKTIIKLLVLLIILAPIYGVKSKTTNLDPFFSIAILAPNTSTSSNPWPLVILEQLPKIGINVSIFDHTGWAQISPRTWGFPGPYPIPSYDDSGYDILIIAYGFDISYSPIDPNAAKTLLVGIGFPTILNILALIGDCYLIKKNKTI